MLKGVDLLSVVSRLPHPQQEVKPPDQALQASTANQLSKMASKTISLHLPYIKTFHKQPYPAISPLRQELSQAGRTVLVVGGSTGIGFAIAKAFVQASSSHVIITGRRQTALADAVSRLEAEATGTAVSGIVSDMSDLQATEKLWNDFKVAGTAIDVLVLNAMAVGEPKSILQAGVASTWSAFETNVRGLLDYAERFHNQGGPHPKVCTPATFMMAPANESVPCECLDLRRPQLHDREQPLPYLRPHQELGHAVDAAHCQGH
jgi:hypothetical protein